MAMFGRDWIDPDDPDFLEEGEEPIQNDIEESEEPDEHLWI